MKNARLITVLGLLIILLTGCAKEGDLTFLNKTNQNIYYTLEGVNYILPGQQSHSYTYRLGKETIFNKPSKDLEITIYGETFMLEDMPSNKTIVTINPDKNLKLYLWPTHAGLKVINNSNNYLNSMVYEQHYNQSLISSPELLASPLAPGDSAWFRMPFSEGNSSTNTYFYYTFKVLNNLGDLTVYGDSTIVLSKGQQHHLIIQ